MDHADRSEQTIAIRGYLAESALGLKGSDAITKAPLSFLDQISKLVHGGRSFLGALTAPTVRAVAAIENAPPVSATELDKVRRGRTDVHTFNALQYDHPEARRDTQPNSIFDEIAYLDPNARTFLSEERRALLEPIFRDRSRLSLVRRSGDALADHGPTSPESYTDSKLRSEYGCFTLEPIESQTRWFQELLRARPEDPIHMITAFVLYELLRRKQSVMERFLSHLYEARVMDATLATSDDFKSETIRRQFEDGTANVDRDHNNWRQSGVTTIFHSGDLLRLNVGLNESIHELSLSFPRGKAHPLQGLYHGNVGVVPHLYEFLYQQIQAQLSDPERRRELTPDHIRKAYAQETEASGWGAAFRKIIRSSGDRGEEMNSQSPPYFSPADMQVNFERIDGIWGDELSGVGELNNLTGNPKEATPLLYTLRVTEKGTLDSIRIRASHRDNNGIVIENALHQHTKEMDVLTQALGKLEDSPSTPPDIFALNSELTELPQVATIEEKQKLMALQEARPVRCKAIGFDESWERGVKERAAELNRALKSHVLQALNIPPSHMHDSSPPYLCNTDLLLTMATGLLANSVSGMPVCERMDYLLETYAGDIAPAIVAVPHDSALFAPYKHLLSDQVNDFSASEKRGERIANALGLVILERRFANDPVYPTTAAPRLAIAAGGFRKLLSTLASITDQYRSRLVDAGTGGLASRLAGGKRRLRKFTPAMSSHHHGQPSISLLVNEDNKRVVTLGIEKGSPLLSKFDSLILSRFVNAILADLDAYAKSVAAQSQ